MSRTDKTNPPRVRAVRGEATLHDRHSYGCMQQTEACTLPEGPGVLLTDYDRATCYWYACEALGKRGKRVTICGCPMCTGSERRRYENRRTRHGARKQIEEQVADL